MGQEDKEGTPNKSAQNFIERSNPLAKNESSHQKPGSYSKYRKMNILYFPNLDLQKLEPFKDAAFQILNLYYSTCVIPYVLYYRE